MGEGPHGAPDHGRGRHASGDGGQKKKAGQKPCLPFSTCSSHGKQVRARGQRGARSETVSSVRPPSRPKVRPAVQRRSDGHQTARGGSSDVVVFSLIRPQNRKKMKLLLESGAGCPPWTPSVWLLLIARVMPRRGDLRKSSDVNGLWLWGSARHPGGRGRPDRKCPKIGQGPEPMSRRLLMSLEE
jgi:hypothetical protein